MNTTKVLIVAVLVALLGGAGFLVFSQMNTGENMIKEDTMMQKTDDAMMKDDTVKVEGDVMMKDEGVMMEEKGDAMMTQ